MAARTRGLGERRSLRTRKPAYRHGDNISGKTQWMCAVCRWARQARKVLLVEGSSPEEHSGAVTSPSIAWLAVVGVTQRLASAGRFRLT